MPRRAASSSSRSWTSRRRRTFERFSDRARQVVVLAQDEARGLGHNYIGTEHLLLGLLREKEGVAARALEALEVTFDDVRARVRAIVGEGQAVATGQIPFTPGAKKALELALREERALGHAEIRTEHLLLGLVEVGEGVASEIMAQLGAESARVRDEVLRLLSGGPA